MLDTSAEPTFGGRGVSRFNFVTQITARVLDLCKSMQIRRNGKTFYILHRGSLANHAQSYKNIVDEITIQYQYTPVLGWHIDGFTLRVGIQMRVNGNQYINKVMLKLYIIDHTDRTDISSYCPPPLIPQDTDYFIIMKTTILHGANHLGHR